MATFTVLMPSFLLGFCFGLMAGWVWSKRLRIPFFVLCGVPGMQ